MLDLSREPIFRVISVHRVDGMSARFEFEFEFVFVPSSAQAGRQAGMQAGRQACRRVWSDDLTESR